MNKDKPWTKLTDKQIQKIYEQVKGANQKLAEIPPKINKIYSKTYKAPGYPVDPRLERARKARAQVGRIEDNTWLRMMNFN